MTSNDGSSRRPSNRHGAGAENPPAGDRGAPDGNGTARRSRAPILNERDWVEALSAVTQEDLDHAFAEITSDIRRPDTFIDGTQAPVDVRSDNDPERSGERTHQVVDADIEEVLELAPSEESAEPTAVEPVSTMPVAALAEEPPPQPPRQRRVPLGRHLLVVVVASMVSAAAGSGLTLLAVRSQGVRQALLHDGPAEDGGDPSSGIAQRSQGNGARDGRDIDPATTTAGDDAGRAAPRTGAPDDAAPIGATQDATGPDARGAVDADPSQEGGRDADHDEDPGPPFDGVPDEMVLPIGFSRARPTIVVAERRALRALARAIIDDRQGRYDIVGFVAADEGVDPDEIQVLGATRAVRARDLLRSFGPSSQRFRARAARPEESMPPSRHREGEHGAVLLRRVER